LAANLPPAIADIIPQELAGSRCAGCLAGAGAAEGVRCNVCCSSGWRVIRPAAPADAAANSAAEPRMTSSVAST
jgi:hypothetical protein